MDAVSAIVAKPDALIRPNPESAGKFRNRSHESPVKPDIFESLFNHLPACVFVIKNSLIYFANPALLRLLDYPSFSDLTGKPITDFIHPEDRKIFEYRRLSESDCATGNGELIRLLRKGNQISRVRIALATLSNDTDLLQIVCLTDMTSEKNTLDHLQASLCKFKAIFDEIEDVLAEVDLEGNVRSVNNNAHLKIWGISEKEAIGLNYRSYLNEKSAQIVRKTYKRIYQTGVAGKVSYEIQRRDGQKKHVEDYASLIYDHEGKPAGFRVVSRDITERKEAEIKLAEHRLCLEAIFSSVNDAIITVDTRLRVIEANKSTEAICGITAENLKHRVLTDCLSQCNQSCCDVIRLTLEKKTTITDYRINCGCAGRQQVANVTCSPLVNHEGSFMGAVMVIRDITLLRNMERELRERNQFQKIVGQSRKMKSVFALIESLADLDTTVLITGESGTGKELVARALHYISQRAFKPFVAVNCSALTENLLESELFGHVKGAFTGAMKDREGRFQAANGGSILLDEIGDLSPIIQLKLLRVLQEKVYERVGETKPRKADVRIITCTNRDLKDKVRRGELREDLYYRLKVVDIALPSLREREEDIPLLVNHFQKVFNQRFSKRVERINPDVLGTFMDYPWPGNVRELEHVMEHAFVLCRGNEITIDDLPGEFKDGIYKTQATLKPSADGFFAEAEALRNALIKARGNKAKAARILGISRQTIYRKIYQYQLPHKS
jgi:PAS domain S-box-containing protein